MGYFYTDHFLERLQQRDISLKQIEDSLQSPDQHYIKDHKEEIFEKNNLRVVVKKKNHHFIFITAYKI